jgi:hypothetical protein
MDAIQKRSLSLHLLGLAFAVVALLGTASTSRSQDLVRGTITLPVAARLGEATLTPGKYRFMIESLEEIRSVDALQIGNSRVAVILSSLNKEGHIVSLVANAFRDNKLNSPSSIDFGTGMTIRSISLTNAGVKVIFTTDRNDHLLQAAAAQPVVRGDD